MTVTTVTFLTIVPHREWAFDKSFRHLKHKHSESLSLYRANRKQATRPKQMTINIVTDRVSSGFYPKM